MMRRVTVTLLALFLMPALLAQAQSDIKHVEAKMQSFRDQLQAAAGAQASGNADMAQKHQRNAERFVQEARTMLDDLNASRSNDFDTIVLYAEVLGSQRQYDLAAQALRRATRLVPNSPALWRSLGRALAEVGPKYTSKAHDALRHALELQPPTELAADIHQIRGQLYLNQGLYELAQRSFEAALALNAQTPGAIAGMAALDVRHGNVAEAEARLQTITEMTPELSGQLQPMLLDALKGMDKNRAWFPDTPENHKAYGMVLLQANRYPQAIDPLQRSLDLAPGDYVTWNLLASVYRGLGNIGRAKEALQKSLELEPNQPRTQEFLQAIEQAEAAAPPPSIAAPETP